MGRDNTGGGSPVTHVFGEDFIPHGAATAPHGWKVGDEIEVSLWQKANIANCIVVHVHDGGTQLLTLKTEGVL